jgi:hypothetical protein
MAKTSRQITDEIVGRALERQRATKPKLEVVSVTPPEPIPLMREMPPPDPFPTDALGEVLSNAAIGIQDRTRAPIAICGQSVLAVATLATQAHANVVLPTGQTRPLSNYFATIGVTGERKSAVDYEATSPIRKREETLRESYDAERLDYENALEAWDRARKHATDACKGVQDAIKSALDRLGSPPAEPLRPLLRCSEPTIEGLMKTLAKGWPSLGVFSDEGGMFIGGHGMTDESKLRTATTLSKLWDGAAIDRVRGGEGAIVLSGRRVAMHLMVQPNVAAMFLADGMLAEQGLLSRVLATYPESEIGKRLWREPSADSEAVLKVYGARLLDILDERKARLPLVAGKRNELEPREIALSEKARQKWVRYHDHVESQMGSTLYPVRGLANKIPEIAARLAGVLALVDDITAPEIGFEDLERGVLLAEHYLAEALRLFEASQVNAELLRAQELLKWLVTVWEHRPNIGLRQIYQFGPNAVRDSSTAKRLVEVLERHGHLVRIQGGAEIGGKHCRDAWKVIGSGL